MYRYSECHCSCLCFVVCKDNNLSENHHMYYSIRINCCLQYVLRCSSVSWYTILLVLVSSIAVFESSHTSKKPSDNVRFGCKIPYACNYHAKKANYDVKNFIGLFSHLQCLEVNLSKLLIFPDYIWYQLNSRQAYIAIYKLLNVTFKASWFWGNKLGGKSLFLKLLVFFKLIFICLYFVGCKLTPSLFIFMCQLINK